MPIIVDESMDKKEKWFEEVDNKPKPDFFPEVTDKPRTIPIMILSVVDDVIIFGLLIYVAYLIFIWATHNLI